jgi:hypothetical protein
MNIPRLAVLLASVAAFTLSAAAQLHPDYDPYTDYGEYPVYPGYPEEPDFQREFSLGVGYARINYSDPSDELDAVHFNGNFSFAPLERLRQLRLGAGFGWSFNIEDVGGIVSSGPGGGFVAVSGDTSLMLFQPELTLGWRQPLGSEEVGFFLEPGVGGGGTFGYFDVDDREFEAAGGEGDPDESSSTWHAKAYLRAGFRVTGGIGGFEMHYLRGGELDFGDQGEGELEHFYIGIFGALRF